MTEEPFHFQVNLGGMLDVLSHHLYTSPDVFVRELLQNGTDAIALRKLREPHWDGGTMRITVEPGKRILFQDDGIGLNEADIHRFLSVIGQSSKRNKLTDDASADYIGRFGIGLLSCFMVSDTIRVLTRKSGEADGYEWQGKPDGTYTIAPTDVPSAGTTVVLEARSDAKRYFQPGRMADLVRHYGLLLSTPVYLDGYPDRLNALPAALDNPNRQQLLSLGTWLFEEKFLDAIPIKTEHLEGVAFVVPYRVSPTARGGHRIFLKRMLLTEDGRSLLPDWAFFLRCFLNTDTLRPTASREGFYEDAALEAARDGFSDAVRDHLTKMARAYPDRLRSLVDIHEEAIKAIATWDDDLFELFIDYLPFETSEGTLTGAALKEIESASLVRSVARFKQLTPIFLAQGRLLICTGFAHDEELMMRFAAAFAPAFTVLGDGDIDIALEEPTFDEWERGLPLMSSADEALSRFDCKAVLRSFHPTELPALYVLGDKARSFRRMKQAREHSSPLFTGALSSMIEAASPDSSAATLYFNASNSLIADLFDITDASMLKSMADVLYAQALMAGGNMLSSQEMAAMTEALGMIVKRGTEKGEHHA